jgi:hypothetical protein
MTPTTATALRPTVLMDTTILAADGSVLGTAEKLIFDVRIHRAVALVVHAGRLQPLHYLLPVGHLVRIGALTADTDLTRDAFEALEPFDARRYQRPSRTLAPPNGWDARCVLWPPFTDVYPVSEIIDSGSEDDSLAGDGNEPIHEPERRVEDVYFEAGATLYNRNPYDALDGPSDAGCKTPYEWGDASEVNPQQRPAPP